jgi:hypothetical protein
MTPYWYLITIYECPACGSTKQYRERQYTPRPPRWEDRHICEVHYDWCDAF